MFSRTSTSFKLWLTQYDWRHYPPWDRLFGPITSTFYHAIQNNDCCGVSIFFCKSRNFIDTVDHRMISMLVVDIIYLCSNIVSRSLRYLLMSRKTVRLLFLFSSYSLLFTIGFRFITKNVGCLRRETNKNSGH